MPNWCETNIKITLGHEIKESEKEKALDQLKKLVAKIETAKLDKENDYCFLGVLFPVPESLRITAGTSTDQGMAVIMSTKYNDHTEIDKILEYEWVKKEKIKTREDLIACLTTGEHAVANLIEGQMAIDNIEKYGCKDWYDWCRINWGTKWDLGYMEFDVLPEEVQICSETAWCPPLAGITKISEEYNLLHFFVEYKEPGVGFQGEADIENGECIDDCREYDYSQEEDYQEENDEENDKEI